MSHEWTELAFLEIQAGNTAMVVFGFAVVMVFLVLAFAVRELVAAAGRDPGGADVPAVRDRGVSAGRSMDINIFTQIGFVVLVGLASKNAILIVEFAKMRREAGESARARRRWTPAGCGCGRSS